MPKDSGLIFLKLCNMINSSTKYRYGGMGDFFETLFSVLNSTECVELDLEEVMSHGVLDEGKSRAEVRRAISELKLKRR